MVPEGIVENGRLAVLCGPTAAGKTALAVVLARRMGAEIVCADSRTVYRHMDIGTAKPTLDQQRQTPHFLLDVADPASTFTLADYQRLARPAIAEIRGRGHLPLLVGGTGLYIRALVDDLTLPAVAPDAELRGRLEADERVRGRGHLHGRLAVLDPNTAARIHPHNTRRLIRALEVTLTTGQPISTLQGRGGVVGPVAVVGLSVPRAALYCRIEARVDEQLAAGFVDEVRGLLASGVPADAPAMQGLGYKEIAGWLGGAGTYEDAVRRLKQHTRNFAKRQMTWFQRVPRIVWVDATEPDTGALAAQVHAIMDAEFSKQGRE